MLCIIAGKYKGRKLSAVKSKDVRPTLGRARQIIFDMISYVFVSENRSLSGTRVIDCFAGTGALGIEAISRGASEAIFIEKSKDNSAVIGKNISFIQEPVSIINSDLFVLSGSEVSSKFADLVFIDPPYAKGLAYLCIQFVVDKGWLKNNALLIIETGDKEELPFTENMVLVKERCIASSKFTILKYIAEC